MCFNNKSDCPGYILVSEMEGYVLENSSMWAKVDDSKRSYTPYLQKAQRWASKEGAQAAVRGGETVVAVIDLLQPFTQ